MQEGMPPQIMRDAVRRWREDVLVPEHRPPTLPATDRQRLLSELSPETVERNADQLPVLAAFQEFLDLERRRTRNRMLVLTGVFLVILIVASSAGLLVGFTFYRRSLSDVGGLRADLAETRHTGALADASNRVALARARVETGRLAASLDEHMAALQADRDEMALRVEGLGTNLALLHNTIARLESDNTGLRASLNDVATRWPALSNQLEAVVAELRAPPPVPLPVRLPPPARAAVPLKPSLVMAIIPGGDTRAVDWRIPYLAIQE